MVKNIVQICKKKGELVNMSNGHGGNRCGSGRKVGSVKPKAEKIKAKELSIEAEFEGADIPEPMEYLAHQTRGASENLAPKIYSNVFGWLKLRRCEHLVQPAMLQKYAMAEARFIQEEEAVHSFGFLSKHPTTGEPMASPFVKISLDYQKQSANLWLQIQESIRDYLNNYENPDMELDPHTTLRSVAFTSASPRSAEGNIA